MINDHRGIPRWPLMYIRFASRRPNGRWWAGYRPESRVARERCSRDIQPGPTAAGSGHSIEDRPSDPEVLWGRHARVTRDSNASCSRAHLVASPAARQRNRFGSDSRSPCRHTDHRVNPADPTREHHICRHTCRYNRRALRKPNHRVHRIRYYRSCRYCNRRRHRILCRSHL